MSPDGFGKALEGIRNMKGVSRDDLVSMCAAIEQMGKTPEAGMSSNPRDTQFTGFADLLLKEMLNQREGRWIDFNEDDKEYAVIVAQRAYDLVEHAILSMSPIAFQSYEYDEIIHSIPDMTEWPEREERIEKIPDLIELSNHPDTTSQLAMSEARLRELVFLAIGRAGMCWSEIPPGTFDDAKAQQIGEELLKAIQMLLREE